METMFSNRRLFLNGNGVITLGDNHSRIGNMLASPLLLASHSRQDFLILSALLRRLPQNVVAQPCSTSAIPKVEQQVERTDAGTERRMPSLPVQPLEQMFQTYIKSIRPFVDQVQLKKTTDLIEQFCKEGNEGKKLQKLLEERAQKNENWLSDWWLNTAYLEYRNPVVVYSSPALVWPKEYLRDLRHQLAYAAYVIHYAMDFNRMIEEKQIPTEMLGGKDALCMSQYERIFGTCRIPDMPSDRLQFQDANNPSRNILIMYNNYLFSIPAFYENTREPVSPEDNYALLLDVAKQGKDLGPAVGVLTTEHRDNWANSYKKLKMDPNNKRILEDHVEKALFIVCIDNPLCVGSGHEYDSRCSKLLLHGFGYRGNAGNRWYDKTIQIIIGVHHDGKGIAYEHSPAEGGVIGVLTDHIYSRVGKNPKVEELSYKKLKTELKAEKLVFTLTESLKEDIEKAGKAVDKLSDELDVFTWSFRGFGKNALKMLNVSPDSFIQVAIQLAFYGLHKRPAAQYESGTLRKYQYGRTDVIRTCSEEVVNFCKLMSKLNEDDLKKYEALKEAIRAHKSYAQDVVNARGVDRHLLALSILAKASKLENPEIFNDVAFKKSTYFQLSTSNVPTNCNGVMVYGPLVPDGYACCYNPRAHTINFGMSAWSTCRDTRLNEFRGRLYWALMDMKSLLESFLEKKKLMPSKL